MTRPTLRSKSAPAIAARAIVLACALIFAGGAAAQMSPDALEPSMSMPSADPGLYGQSNPYGQPNYGEPPRRQSARAVFGLTLASLLAQGIGSGLSAGLSEGLRGSIVRWFQNASAGSGAPVDVEPDQPRARADGAGAPALQAGMAFEVHRLGRDGNSAPVEPERHVFRTGDRFVVYYRPTLPGRVSVHNVNGERVESRIDSAQVAAGQLAALGPYEFVGRQGDETLRIVLAPCTTPALMKTTRSIVKAQGAALPTSQPRLGGCDDAPGQATAARARSIRRVAVDGSTAFALDPVSDGELASGALAPREVTIRLKHRQPEAPRPRPEPTFTASYVQ